MGIKNPERDFDHRMVAKTISANGGEEQQTLKGERRQERKGKQKKEKGRPHKTGGGAGCLVALGLDGSEGGAILRVAHYPGHRAPGVE